MSCSLLLHQGNQDEAAGYVITHDRPYDCNKIDIKKITDELKE